MKAKALRLFDRVFNYLPFMDAFSSCTYEIVVFDGGKRLSREYGDFSDITFDIEAFRVGRPDFELNKIYRFFGREYKRKNITSAPKIDSEWR